MLVPKAFSACATVPLTVIRFPLVAVTTIGVRPDSTSRIAVSTISLSPSAAASSTVTAADPGARLAAPSNTA